MNAFLVRLSLVAVITYLLIAAAISLALEEYIVSITVVMGAILGLLAFRPLEATERAIPLRINYVLVFAFMGFCIGRSIEASTGGQVVLAAIYACFVACMVVGGVIGKYYRPWIQKLLSCRNEGNGND